MAGSRGNITEQKTILIIFCLLTLISLILTFFYILHPNARPGNDILGFSNLRFIQICVFGSLSFLFGFISKQVFDSTDVSRLTTLIQSRWGYRLSVLLPGSGILIGGLLLDGKKSELGELIFNYVIVWRPVIVWGISACAVILVGTLWIRSYRKSKWFDEALILLISVGYLWLRARNILAIETTYSVGDSVEYIGGKLPEFLFSAQLWNDPRPFLIPLINTLLGMRETVIGLFQSGLSIFAWLFLANTVARTFKKSKMRSVPFGLVLAFSLGYIIPLWDWTILSESLTISFMVILIGLWILTLQRTTWRSVSLLVIFSLLFVFTRDANGWLLIPIGLLSLLVGIRQLDRRFTILGLAMLAIFMISNYSASHSQPLRWQGPFMHVLVRRILPEQERLDHFTAAGMPVNEEVMSWAGGLPNWHNFFNDDSMQPFRQWVQTEGKRTLFSFLASHLNWALCKPFEDPGFPVPIPGGIGYPTGYKAILPQPIESLFYFGFDSPTVWVLSFLLLITVLFYFRKNLSDLVLVGSLAFLLALPYGFLMFHGDALDVDRHLIPADILLRLGFLLLLIGITDKFTLKLSKQDDGKPHPSRIPDKIETL